MPLAMSPAEREAFLAETHVGIVSIAEEGRGPLAVPARRPTRRKRGPAPVPARTSAVETRCVS